MSQPIRCQSKNPAACRFHGSGGVTKQQVDAAYQEANNALSLLVEMTKHNIPSNNKQEVENEYNNALKKAHDLTIKYDTTAEGYEVLKQELHRRGFPQSRLDEEGDKLAARLFYAEQVRAEEQSYNPNPIANTKYSERELCVEYGIPKKYLDKVLYRAPAGLVNKTEKPSKELVAARVETMIAKYNFRKAQEEEFNNGLFGIKIVNERNADKAYKELKKRIQIEEDLHFVHMSNSERILLQKIEARK